MAVTLQRSGQKLRLKPNVAVIGCGLMGRRRAAFAKASGAKVTRVVDIESSRAEELAESLGTKAETHWEKVIQSRELDIVIVSTVNRDLASISLAALQAGKHVLCEKPAAGSAKELAIVVEQAEQNNLCFWVGYNHRYHPAIWKAKELFEKGTIGRGISIRCRYGHGGRKNYDQEWRTNQELALGGVLLDQGVHVVDLCRWFFGEFAEVSGKVSTDFWPIAPLEDNAWGLLRTTEGRTAMFHNSWTQWRNLFSFELLGREGLLIVEGLGASYGTERLTVWKRKKHFGVPDLLLDEEYTGEDRSWELEWGEFVQAIEQKGECLSVSGREGVEVLHTIEAIYESSKKGRVIPL